MMLRLLIHTSVRRLIIAVLFFTAGFLLSPSTGRAEDGYRLWLRYDLVSNSQKLNAYRAGIKSFLVDGESPTLTIAANELQSGLTGLLGSPIKKVTRLSTDATLLAVTSRSPLLTGIKEKEKLKNIGKEGFILLTTLLQGKKVTLIIGNEDIGVLYGVFHFYG